MRTLMQKLLACCLLICLLLAPARAEMPASREERYAQELSLLDSYLQNSATSGGLDIRGIYDVFAENGNIGEHATGFRGYAEALALTEEGNFAGALAVVENLQNSASYEAFRVYLEDGEDLQARGLYAIRPLDELEAYVLARECEAQGRYEQAVGYYDQCQTFFDAYDRRAYAVSVTPSPTPVPTPSPTPSPTPVATPSPSNILASRFVERFPNADAVREDTREIRFLSTLRDAPAGAIDVSQEKMGSIRAWLAGDVLYIAANGTVYAPENAAYLFAFYTHLETIDFGGCFDTGNVRDMSQMFRGCSNLRTLDLSSFNTAKVTSMFAMFSSCYSLTELDVSNFDTKNVRDMSWMFSGCSSLVELDVSSFDTGNVTNMSSMFAGCRSLIELDISGFDMRKALGMGTSNMFSNCPVGNELNW